MNETKPKPGSTPGGSPGSQVERIIGTIAPLIAPIGYEVVHLEIVTGRQKLLRLFIDRLEGVTGGIGIEDCAKVSKALDEPLDQAPELEKVFGGSSYELEVSSPGVDRPLRLMRDYERFAGQEARIHVYRPLTAEELENQDYHQKNPKQKNFVGTLKGIHQEKVRIALPLGKTELEVSIPIALISKANLEPNFDILDKEGAKP